ASAAPASVVGLHSRPSLPVPRRSRAPAPPLLHAPVNLSASAASQRLCGASCLSTGTVAILAASVPPTLHLAPYSRTEPPEPEPVANTFRCRLITPEAQVLDEPAVGAVIPCWDGQLGILAHRAALVTELGTGEL